MVRQSIILGLGTPGLRIANSIVNQLEEDNEQMIKQNQTQDLSFFTEIKPDQRQPHCLLYDMDPDTVRFAPHLKSIEPINSRINPSYVKSGTEDPCGNFARGQYSTNRNITQQFIDSIRTQVEKIDNLGTIYTFQAWEGGSAGAAMKIHESMSTDYGKIDRIGLNLLNCQKQGQGVLGSYNQVLCTNMGLDHQDISINVDNQQIGSIISRELDVDYPSLKQINYYLAQMMSNLTINIRQPFVRNSISHQTTTNYNTSTLLRNLVPYPRIHAVIPFMGGLAPFNMEIDEVMEKEDPDVQALVAEATSMDNMMLNSKMKRPNYYCSDEACIANNLYGSYGSFINVQSSRQLAVREPTRTGFKQNSKIQDFIGIEPAGGILISKHDQESFSSSNQTYFKPQSTVVSGLINTDLVNVVYDHLAHQFDLLYAKRAYVHWYVGEGMEEGEFSEAREDLAALQKDYEGGSCPGCNNSYGLQAEEEENDGESY